MSDPLLDQCLLCVGAGFVAQLVDGTLGMAYGVTASSLLMGVVIVLKAFREFPPRVVTTHLAPLGFIGAFVDALGGGGWGPSWPARSSSAATTCARPSAASTPWSSS